MREGTEETKQNQVEIFKALAKAQSKIVGAVKDSDNPFFKSKYADLASVMDAIKAAFTENGLAYYQRVYTAQSAVATVKKTDQETIEKNEQVNFIETVIVHSSGGFITSGAMQVLCGNSQDPQKVAAAVTYYRRMQLSALAGVSQVDDDGNTVSQGITHQQSQPMASNSNKNAPLASASGQGVQNQRPVKNYAPKA
jgi:hypothetical protein